MKVTFFHVKCECNRQVKERSELLFAEYNERNIFSSVLIGGRCRVVNHMDCFHAPTCKTINASDEQSQSVLTRHKQLETPSLQTKKKQKAATLSLITRYSQIGHKSLLVIPKSHHINETKDGCDFSVNTS